MKNTLLTQIEELEHEILDKKKQLAKLRSSKQKRPIQNYEFVTSSNQQVTLHDLFGEKDQLIIIHNMGKGCSYCTMWTDGFNGVYHHLIDQASFVLASPDTPDVQGDLAAERQWKFPMISVKDSTFTTDMGFQKGKQYYPGVSTFHKDEDGHITLHAQAPFGPGDDYCVTWHLFDLLPSTSENVEVKRKIHDRSPFQITNNIAIGVREYEKAIPFYRDILGFKLEQSFENETKFSMSGTNFYLEKSSDNNTHFEFSVTHIDSAKTLLLENGCTITKVYSDKSVMIADPFGMKFHLFESK
ncbi:DUF899 family protein [Peribacillus alkalitolerans]|uniref:DUF899 family protein n=1 Tax=Peribacillus alkalitolerans TaxID=1550385 RepID=UPI0013D7DA2B|nr:DUF899 family protein [Peribacillus alkalitolerans]